jgi:3-methyladenine DNA glycosylase AlkC
MADINDQSAPALKEIFNRQRLRHIATETKTIYPAFDENSFLTMAEAKLDDLGIMQRMRLVATSLHATLPGDYHRNLEILTALAPRIDHGFASISLPEYVALYGLEHFDVSMEALQFFTRFGSSEFAIRHFLLRDMPRTLAVMETWSHSDNEHVRRLASEGCRPRLPWSFQLKELIADPSPVTAILENMKDDPSLYVRKSVANHLNDITKDHPQWVLDRLANWPVGSQHSAWIIKQALRTLVKKGNTAALAHLGVAGKAEVAVEDFSVSPNRLALGGNVRLSASLLSTAKVSQKLVIDYAVHYVKKSGETSAKVFKWKALSLAPQERCTLTISRAVRDFTTRKHYAGRHRIELIINGDRLAETAFDLTL